ncbi:MAG: hypothetical protein OEO77_08405 [Acidimicrobiia bacterium]|nr:hypothetical protein [Acidimicrobiia bacterium]
MDRLIIRRTPWRPFGLALIALPVLAVAYDFASGGRLLGSLGEILYRNGEVEAFEVRDVFWVALYLIAGVLSVIWGVKELAIPRPVVVADDEGLHVLLRGPFLPASFLGWSDFDDARAGTVDLVGESRPALVLTVVSRSRLPGDPWGARWTSDHTLAVDTTGWDRPAATAGADLTQKARAVRLAHRAPPLS